MYLSAKYRSSPAVFRLGGRPVYYVYDSYRLPTSDWADLLLPGGDSSVRATDDDGEQLSLVRAAQSRAWADLRQAG
jgi:glycoprotein endo-alpha-1,2-mannosidase